MTHLVSRVLQMTLIALFLSVGLFALLSAMPGNPVEMLITSNPRIKPEDIARLKKLRGLDKPWYVQYYRWMWGYYEPYQAPRIQPVTANDIQWSSDGSRVSLDLSQHLGDSNFQPEISQLLQKIARERPQLFKKLAPAISTNKDQIETATVLEAVINEDISYYNLLSTYLQQQAFRTLKIEGLFGARMLGSYLFADLSPTSFHRLWFRVTNAQGLETVGSVQVERHSELMSTETRLIIDEIPQQVADDAGAVTVDLKKFVRCLPSVCGRLEFKLLGDYGGSINDQGRYTRRFINRGQSAIMFSVQDERGVTAHGALAVEHGWIINQKKFSRGFVFIFAGDSAALGYSNTYKRPVWELLAGESSVKIDGTETVGASLNSVIINSGRIGNTLQLMIPALLLSLLIALPLGVLSAYRQYSWLDYIVNFLAFIGISLPVFWFGIMIIFIFAEKLQWFPAGGMQTPGLEDGSVSEVLIDRIEHLALPVLTLSIAYAGRWLRYMRASMLEVLPADYIRTARAKGLSEGVVILKHALRNALIPVVTVLAISIPSLFGGAVLTETVFAWPGIGRLQYDAVMNSDYYVAIVVFLISAVLVMVGNLFADLLYLIVDPRIRHS